MTILSTSKNNDIAEFAGQDISESASITRDTTTKKATFVSSLLDDWELYSGVTAESIDFSTPISTGKGSGEFPLDVPDDERCYFQLVTKLGKAILAERHLPMTGGFNFRDLGGYKTIENRFTKWGKIIRSDDLATLTDADLGYLSSIPLITVVDFRSEQEINDAPNRKPKSLHNDFDYSISPGNLSEMMVSLKTMNEAQVDEMMQKMNELFVTDAAAIEQYRKLFKLLQNPSESVPLLYHCTAGKDRTGMASALILSALGVDEKTVLNDYLLSNKYIKAKFATEIKAHPQLISLFSVKAKFLQAGLDQIKKDHGNIENYLTQTLNVDVDLDMFRELYLY